ncbi:MAG: metallophosphoesterase family protein, partial [Synergistaceae bacterium]|nr:metallophosphoesterase family protein [Synergistaceae bacterium]
PISSGDILLHGHTHVPAWEEFGDCYYLNPGSVSIPKNNSQHGYMILNDEGFVWKDLDGRTYHELKF